MRHACHTPSAAPEVIRPFKSRHTVLHLERMKAERQQVRIPRMGRMYFRQASLTVFDDYVTVSVQTCAQNRGLDGVIPRVPKPGQGAPLQAADGHALMSSNFCGPPGPTPGQRSTIWSARPVITARNSLLSGSGTLNFANARRI